MWHNCNFALAQVQPTADKKDLHMPSAHCTCVGFYSVCGAPICDECITKNDLVLFI